MSPTSDQIFVDRETFKELKMAVGHCIDTLSLMRISEVFIQATNTYLYDLENNEVEKAMLLLNCWLDDIPEKTEETINKLDSAYQIMNCLMRKIKDD